jgi:hypothetical protein
LGEIGKLSEEMETEYILWRIWKKTSIPIDELRYKWTYSDILKANALLDMDNDYESAMNEMMDEEANKNRG